VREPARLAENAARNSGSGTQREYASAQDSRGLGGQELLAEPVILRVMFRAVACAAACSAELCAGLGPAPPPMLLAQATKNLRRCQPGQFRAEPGRLVAGATPAAVVAARSWWLPVVLPGQRAGLDSVGERAGEADAQPSVDGEQAGAGGGVVGGAGGQAVAGIHALARGAVLPWLDVACQQHPPGAECRGVQTAKDAPAAAVGQHMQGEHMLADPGRCQRLAGAPEDLICAGRVARTEPAVGIQAGLRATGPRRRRHAP
jgi:hypothetical protein